MSAFSEDRQDSRLAFIDLCAYVLGYVNRNLLMMRFNIKQATASKDIKSYLEKTSNLTFDNSSSVYRPVPWFVPYYEHSFDEALLLLTKNKQEVVVSDVINPSYALNLPVNTPQVAKVCAIFRAVSRQAVVEMHYASRSSGVSNRIVVPHTLIRIEAFVYVRAFDRQSNEFRTFKLNRIISSHASLLSASKVEHKSYDIEWSQELEVTIVPNGEGYTETIAMDYQLVNNKMVIHLKKPTLMLFLMGWNVAPLEFEQLPYELFPLKVVSIKEI